MDRRRRRFVPSSEGLEQRQVLSTSAFAPLAPAVNGLNPYSTGPAGAQIDGAGLPQETVEAKRRHISNLPYFIGLLNKDNVVPQPTVQNIQNDLNALVASFHYGNPSVISTFNLDLRKAQPYANITPKTASALNRDFGAALVASGASPGIVADLQVQMTQLVNYDSTQPNSNIVATNDYATVLELALGSGSPLVYPNVPSLLGADHNGNNGKIPITHNHRPSLTGNYAIGVNIQIVDRHNKVVLGETSVNSTTGVYTVQFANPLPDGTYTVRTRVEDSGIISDPSPIFTFRVVTPPIPR